MNIDVTNLKFIDEKMRKLIAWLEDETSTSFTITSLYRVGDRGVHGTLPVRGIDLKMRNFHFGNFLEKYINAHWVYDPKRGLQCALLHDAGDGLHLHLQVHKNSFLKDL